MITGLLIFTILSTLVALHYTHKQVQTISSRLDSTRTVMIMLQNEVAELYRIQDKLLKSQNDDTRTLIKALECVNTIGEAVVVLKDRVEYVHDNVNSLESDILAYYKKGS